MAPHICLLPFYR